MSKLPTDTPETIYIQIDADGETPKDFQELHEVTWCADKINENDVRYIRADKAEAVIAEQEAEIERLKAIPHLCPVCNGKGIVTNGFYSSVSGTITSSSATPEQCQTCNGLGALTTPKTDKP